MQMDRRNAVHPSALPVEHKCESCHGGIRHGCHTELAVRYFNTEGPVDSSEHYCIDPLDRVDPEEILTLISRKKSFVLHAPRQTGKTSTLLSLQDRLNGEGEYRCVYANFEVGHAAGEDTGRAMRALLGRLASRSRRALQDDFVGTTWPEILEREGPDGALCETLVRWAGTSPKPLVLLIDEIDTLVGDTLISVLRQLRAEYDGRPEHFPQSVVLCGVLDVRDYQMHASRAGTGVPGGSAFHVKAKSLRLGNFSEGEVQALLAQHTAETGQGFEDAAALLVWQLTRGQPWLVNALAYQACFEDRAGRDRTRPIRADRIEEAREALVLQRVTHHRQLAETLRERRVQRVVEPILSGSPYRSYSFPDLRYVRDLGLIALDDPPRVANPIYAEVIPRELTSALQSDILQEAGLHVGSDGSLDCGGLMAAFQDWFRRNSEHWIGLFQYKEAGPQLLLQGFLQRTVSGGGRVEREYGLGRGRTDLLVVWPRQWREQRAAVECKVRRGGLDATIASGLEHLAGYADRCEAEEGHLVLFDMGGARWRDKVFHRTKTGPGGMPVQVWGM